MLVIQKMMDIKEDQLQWIFCKKSAGSGIKTVISTTFR